MKHSLHLYGTLGPACATKEKIRTMFLSGMTGMRLNLSHSNLDDCKDWLQQYYEVSESFLNFLLIYRVLNFASELWIFHSPFPRMILFFLYQKNHLIKEKKTPLYFHES
jgi:hypothetical protein